MTDTCPSCALLRPDARHITDLPDMLLPTGQCGALLHPVWADECLERRHAALIAIVRAADEMRNALSAEATWAIADQCKIYDAARKLAVL